MTISVKIIADSIHNGSRLTTFELEYPRSIHVKVVCTATEYDNFFYLRCHPDAQPEIMELTNQMYAAREASTPTVLEPGDWHVPYFGDGHWYADLGNPFRTQDYPSLEDALAISSSCCAQVSYRKPDDSIEKAHALNGTVTDALSGNLRGWIQHRQLIPDNTCHAYAPAG